MEDAVAASFPRHTTEVCHPAPRTEVCHPAPRTPQIHTEDTTGQSVPRHIFQQPWVSQSLMWRQVRSISPSSPGVSVVHDGEGCDSGTAGTAGHAAGREAGSQQVPPCPEGNPCAVLTGRQPSVPYSGGHLIVPHAGGACVCPPRPPSAHSLQIACGPREADRARFSVTTITHAHCLHQGVLFLRPRMQV